MSFFEPLLDFERNNRQTDQDNSGFLQNMRFMFDLMIRYNANVIEAWLAYIVFELDEAQDPQRAVQIYQRSTNPSSGLSLEQREALAAKYEAHK